jgi:hypothetical protein
MMSRIGGISLAASRAHGGIHPACRITSDQQEESRIDPETASSVLPSRIQIANCTTIEQASWSPRSHHTDHLRQLWSLLDSYLQSSTVLEGQAHLWQSKTYIVWTGHSPFRKCCPGGMDMQQCMPRMQLVNVTRRVEEWLVAVLVFESVARLHRKRLWDQEIRGFLHLKCWMRFSASMSLQYQPNSYMIISLRIPSTDIHQHYANTITVERAFDMLENVSTEIICLCPESS